MTPDEILERRRRELEDTEPQSDGDLEFEEHSGCGTVETVRELCAATMLGLSTTFTSASLRSAFKRCALKVHPDKTGGDDAAFQRLVKAYNTLKGRATADERCIRDLEAERSEPLPEPDHMYGDLERSYKTLPTEDWTRDRGVEKSQPPKRVAFKDFHSTFERLKQTKAAGTMVAHRVGYLPFQSSLAPCNIHGEDSGATGIYADLNSAYA
jgi:hypothetical protein